MYIYIYIYKYIYIYIYIYMYTYIGDIHYTGTNECREGGTGNLEVIFETVSIRRTTILPVGFMKSTR